MHGTMNIKRILIIKSRNLNGNSITLGVQHQKRHHELNTPE